MSIILVNRAGLQIEARRHEPHEAGQPVDLDGTLIGVYKSEQSALKAHPEAITVKNMAQVRITLRAAEAGGFEVLAYLPHPDRVAGWELTKLAWFARLYHAVDFCNKPGFEVETNL